jgi:ABC-type nitrate/sulfonate/bicarbonate transport system substrate-binding protein
MKRLFTVLAAVLLLVGAACGSDSRPAASSTTGGTGAAAGDAGTAATAPKGAPQKVTVVLDWTPNTNHSGLYLAQQRGYYKDAGLDVEILQPDQNGAEQQLAAGNAMFAVSVSENILPARAQGIPLVSIAAILQHNTSSLVAPADRGITRPRDLAGKTYGGYGGPLEEPLVKALVSCDGGDPNSVKFVQVGNVDYRVGFDQHAFDFAWLFDGWDVIRMRDIDHLPLTVLDFAAYPQCIPDWYTPVLATTEQVIKDKPEVVRAFLAATTRGYQDAIADPQGAADALMKAAPESDRDLVTRSANWLAGHYADDPSAWGRQDPKVWATFESWLRDHGILDKPVDSTKAFTNDFLPAAR